MDQQDCLEVERLGGFAGFGLPGAHLRSHGQVMTAALSAADDAWVQELFNQPARPDIANANVHEVRDGFRYRLTRHVAGRTQSIEVDEYHVPSVIRECVKDDLV